MTTAVRTGIKLEVGCDHDVCSQFAFPLLKQLSEGYEDCSVLPVPVSLEEWELDHKTAAKRTRRALKRGYYVTQIKRENHSDELHVINTSLSRRQGRPMSSGYRTPQTYSPLPDYPCERHAIRTWGVFSAERELVGYLTMYRVGQLVLVSQILGHGDHLGNEVMWLLFTIAMSYEIGNPGMVVYNRHDSGTDGLRWFKERLGFEETAVEWLL